MAKDRARQRMKRWQTIPEAQTEESIWPVHPHFLEMVARKIRKSHVLCPPSDIQNVVGPPTSDSIQSACLMHFLF